jgi:5'-nucleotidase
LPKPTISKNSVGENVLVNQVGCYGLNLGRIDFYFDSHKNLASKGKSIIV